MRQDSETNIIVLNTALKYKIQRITYTKKTQIYQIYKIQTHTKKHKHTKHKHILKRANTKVRIQY